MNEPRRHHYVPQFYLKRFADARGRLWVWDKSGDRVFPSTPSSIAVETDFYKIHDFVPLGHDPFTMEKQLAGIDANMAAITGRWLDWLRAANLQEKIEIPRVNREIVSRFMALQFLRTADTKDILCAIEEEEGPGQSLLGDARTRLHTELLWDLDLVNLIARYIEQAIWIFARNPTSTPLMTSDNPVAFRTNDNARWLKVGFVGGTYVVYPLAPDIVMFCHERAHLKKGARLDATLSPILLTDEMVESENTGQVFMARRFVISPVNDFDDAQEFDKTIGTDTYARQGKTGAGDE